MTDNRTIELLPCPFCGGEASKRLFYGSKYGIYCDECSARVGGLYDTEAEAIAAWNTRADYHGYEQAAIEAWESIKAWNTRAANGTLTAEQVMAIAGKHQPDYCSDTHVCFDWQAIADEMNAELGSGTCEFSPTTDSPPTCSNCGWQADTYDCDWLDGGAYEYDGRFCKHCGALVRKAVTR